MAGDDARKSVGVGRGGTVLPTILEEYPRIWGLNVNVVINKRSQRKVSIYNIQYTVQVAWIYTVNVDNKNVPIYGI